METSEMETNVTSEEAVVPMTTTPTPNTGNVLPAVGQVWQAWDSRSRPAGGSHVKIKLIAMEGGELRAFCDRVARAAGGVWVSYGTEVVIKVRRMRPTSTGYRHVEG